MPRGRTLVVVFLGSDGSGKTTLVEAVKAALPDETVNIYLGEKEFATGLAESAFLASNRPEAGAVPARWLTALYNYLLLPLDLLCRCIAARRGASGRILLIDRVPGFPFVSGSRLLRTIYRGVLPRPDLVVLLHGEPAVLAARKPDATMRSIASDTSKFRNVAHALGAAGVVEIDTGHTSPCDTLKRVLSEMERHNHRAREVSCQP